MNVLNLQETYEKITKKIHAQVERMGNKTVTKNLYKSTQTYQNV